MVIVPTVQAKNTNTSRTKGSVSSVDHPATDIVLIAPTVNIDTVMGLTSVFGVDRRQWDTVPIARIRSTRSN
jgi:hypothetical protein